MNAYFIGRWFDTEVPVWKWLKIKIWEGQAYNSLPDWIDRDSVDDFQTTTRAAIAAICWMNEQEIPYHIEWKHKQGIRSRTLNWNEQKDIGERIDCYFVVYGDTTPVLLKMFFDRLKPYDL